MVFSSAVVVKTLRRSVGGGGNGRTAIASPDALGVEVVDCQIDTADRGWGTGSNAPRSTAFEECVSALFIV
jgi:hypothetical protein